MSQRLERGGINAVVESNSTSKRIEGRNGSVGNGKVAENELEWSATKCCILSIDGKLYTQDGPHFKDRQTIGGHGVAVEIRSWNNICRHFICQRHLCCEVKRKWQLQKPKSESATPKIIQKKKVQYSRSHTSCCRKSDARAIVCFAQDISSEIFSDPLGPAESVRFVVSILNTKRYVQNVQMTDFDIEIKRY